MARKKYDCNIHLMFIAKINENDSNEYFKLFRRFPNCENRVAKQKLSFIQFPIKLKT